MIFQFESMADFLQMAGHGPYVWVAYGVSAVVLCWLLIRPMGQRRQLLRQIARELKRRELKPSELKPREPLEE